ncbi:MAG TPA: glucuronate isomerase, partial [Clostridiaceae bacterium]|nr:glucuronate isomerase [Clostridiaceae bacterium]
KWSHSKKVIAKVLLDKYDDIYDTGWKISDDEIKRDVEDLFGRNFLRFLGKTENK